MYKIKLLYELGNYYLDKKNTADAIRMGQDQLNLSKLNSFNNGIISAYTLIACSYLLNKNYSKALENYFLETEANSIKLKIKNRKATKNRNLKGDTGIGHKNVDQILKIFYKDKHHIHVEDEGEFYACSLTLND